MEEAYANIKKILISASRDFKPIMLFYGTGKAGIILSFADSGVGIFFTTDYTDYTDF